MQSQASIGSMIRFSWAKSREILFPFNFKRWFKILVIVGLAIVGIQGCIPSFKVPIKTLEGPFAPKKVIVRKFSQVAPPPMMKKMPRASSVQIPPFPGAPGDFMGQAQSPLRKRTSPVYVSPDAERIAKLRAQTEPRKFKVNPVLTLWLVAGTAVLGLFFAVFFMWLSSRFNFIFLETLVTKVPAIKEPFRRHKEAGNSYFKWSLNFLAVILGVSLILGLIVFGLLGLAKTNMMMAATLGIFAGLVAAAVLLGIALVGVSMRDFVLPLMYREKIPAMEAMNKLFRSKTFAFRRIFQYLLVVFGFWVLAAIVQSIIFILATVGALIAGGIMAFPWIFLVKALPFLKFPLIILLGLVAVALVLVVIVVAGMPMLPAVIFFRVFALAFLTRLYPECDLLGFTREKS